LQIILLVNFRISQNLIAFVPMRKILTIRLKKSQRMSAKQEMKMLKVSMKMSSKSLRRKRLSTKLKLIPSSTFNIKRE